MPLHMPKVKLACIWLKPQSFCHNNLNTSGTGSIRHFLLFKLNSVAEPKTFIQIQTYLTIVQISLAQPSNGIVSRIVARNKSVLDIYIYFSHRGLNADSSTCYGDLQYLNGDDDEISLLLNWNENERVI